MRSKRPGFLECLQKDQGFRIYSTALSYLCVHCWEIISEIIYYDCKHHSRSISGGQSRRACVGWSSPRRTLGAHRPLRSCSGWRLEFWWWTFLIWRFPESLGYPEIIQSSWMTQWPWLSIETITWCWNAWWLGDPHLNLFEETPIQIPYWDYVDMFAVSIDNSIFDGCTPKLRTKWTGLGQNWCACLNPQITGHVQCVTIHFWESN